MFNVGDRVFFAEDINNKNFKDFQISYCCLTNERYEHVHFASLDISAEDVMNCYFKNCIFEEVYLKNAITENCIFENCNFKNISINDYQFYCKNNEFIDCKGLPDLYCPESRSFIGYKKAVMLTDINKCLLVKLEIPEDALRSSAFRNKCRCSKAKVLSITSLDEIELFEEACSGYDFFFAYKVGETVEVEDFDTNR